MKETTVKSKSGSNAGEGGSLSARQSADAEERASAKARTKKLKAMLLRSGRSFSLFSYPGAPPLNCHGGPPGEAEYDAASVAKAFEGFIAGFAVAGHCRKAAGLTGYGDVPPGARIRERDIYRIILSLREEDRAEAARRALGLCPATPLRLHFRTSAGVDAILAALSAPAALFMDERTTPPGKESTAFLHLLLRLYHERDRLACLEEAPPSSAISLRRAARSAAACLKSLTRRGLPEAVRHAAALMDAVLDLCRVEVKRLAEESNALRRAVNFTEPTNRLR